MNDDDVLPTNIVDSSSSKGDEAVGSGSLEVAPLKGNVKPLALGGKGRQTSDSWNHFTKYQDDGRMRARSCGGEIDDSSIFDLSVAFSQTVEKQDNIRGTNEVERWRTVSSQAAALHAVACGSVVITMLDKPTVHDVEV
ncbi:hypothetical protein Q3G72_000540 [Acer saccharum]|nr:hypothetical protein Q3G72_000540 [Acer saccharum]